MQCVELKTEETLYWRYQKGKPTSYLATAEAIYYFVVAVHVNCLGLEYNNEYDNLLFFFKYFYEKIHNMYGSDNLIACKDIG